MSFLSLKYNVTTYEAPSVFPVERGYLQTAGLFSSRIRFSA